MRLRNEGLLSVEVTETLCPVLTVGLLSSQENSSPLC